MKPVVWIMVSLVGLLGLLLWAVGWALSRALDQERQQRGPQDMCAVEGHDVAPLEDGGQVCVRCCRVWEKSA